jgi:hypothetical protein
MEEPLDRWWRRVWRRLGMLHTHIVCWAPRRVLLAHPSGVVLLVPVRALLCARPCWHAVVC